MQKFIEWEKQQPLDYSTMKKHAPAHCAVRLYDSLKSFGSLRQAMGGKPCMILLYELHKSDKRTKAGVGHYVLIIAGKTPRYWTSYGYPVDYEIAATHSGTRLKQLLGSHKNSRIGYQSKEHSQTCWKWCLMRANLYKLPESGFKQLFYNSNPKISSHDDLISIASLCLLGADEMAQRLLRSGLSKGGDSSGRDTAARDWRKRTKSGRKELPARSTPVPIAQGKRKNIQKVDYSKVDYKRILKIPIDDRTPAEKLALKKFIKENSDD